MSAADVIQALVCVTPIVGVAVLSWRDPAGHFAAEQERRLIATRSESGEIPS